MVDELSFDPLDPLVTAERSDNLEERAALLTPYELLRRLRPWSRTDTNIQGFRSVSTGTKQGKRTPERKSGEKQWWYQVKTSYRGD